jgi:predicted N-acyltransferase
VSLTVRWLARLDALPAADWDALRPDDNPFVSHAFLGALEPSGSLRAELGWRAEHLTLWRADKLDVSLPVVIH